MMTAIGKSSTPHVRVAPPRIAKKTITGREKRNSIPLLRMIRVTQIERGMDVERTSRASFEKALVKSVTDALNQTHGRSAVMRKTMYGSVPTVRSNTCVKTNQ